MIKQLLLIIYRIMCPTWIYQRAILCQSKLCIYLLSLYIITTKLFTLPASLLEFLKFVFQMRFLLVCTKISLSFICTCEYCKQLVHLHTCKIYNLRTRLLSTELGSFCVCLDRLLLWKDQETLQNNIPVASKIINQILSSVIPCLGK